MYVLGIIHTNDLSNSIDSDGFLKKFLGQYNSTDYLIPV